MKCPACNKEVTKLLRGGLCPNKDCKAPLKKVIKEDDNGEKFTDLAFRKPRDVKKDNDVEEFITIHNQNYVKIEKSNKNNYIVTYDRKMNFSWIYCPSCESKMFQNNTLVGSPEFKCHKCKAVITYVFK